jgi:hypothetical protein
MIIQVLLIAAFVLVLVWALQNRRATRLRAWKKLLLVMFIAFAAVAIIWPQTLTDVAHLVGVGRGTDLLLYVLVVSFVFVVLSIYLKFKDLEQRYAKLARHIALVEAGSKPRSKE